MGALFALGCRSNGIELQMQKGPRNIAALSGINECAYSVKW